MSYIIIKSGLRDLVNNNSGDKDSNDDDDNDDDDNIDDGDYGDDNDDDDDDDDDDIETRRVLIELLAAYIGRFINVSSKFRLSVFLQFQKIIFCNFKK